MDTSGLVLPDGSRGNLHDESDGNGERRRDGTGEESFGSILVADARLAGEPLVLDRTLNRLPEATIRPDNHTVTTAGIRRLYVSATDTSEEAFDAALAEDDSVVDATHVATFPDALTYRLDLSDETVLLEPTGLEFGVRTATVRGHAGEWRASLRIPDRDALVEFRTYCIERGISFGLDSLYQTNPFENSVSSLTDRQRKALLTACKMGYYDSPRRATQDDVATELGISTSAVSLLLRRATAQLIRETL